MRFTADGVDIPNELLWAHDDGRVVFVCGAGVSQARARLPNFRQLTSMVLNDLHTHAKDVARTKFEMAESYSGIAAYDQVFQLLRRNFTDADIAASVAKHLKPAASPDLRAHKILLNLARQVSGRIRILTTNFDRLFEASAPRLNSMTRSNLPRLEFEDVNWEGIVHLHGCVCPDYSGATSDGFVLSSSEFGSAYLAHGWARDFLKHMLRRHVVVFVGYSAEDPPIRYLLEGLQQLNSSAGKTYAFQSDSDDAALAAWNDKGVEALTYSAIQGDDHRCLWETLDEWAQRAKDPRSWRKRVIKKARKGPANLLPHERGMVAHMLSSSIGAREFAEHRPVVSAEWLCVFDASIRYRDPLWFSRDHSGQTQTDPFARYKLDNDPPPLSKEQSGSSTSRIPRGAWTALQPLAQDFSGLATNNIAGLQGYFARHIPNLPKRLSYLMDWIVAAAKQPETVWWVGQQGTIHSDLLQRALSAAGSKAPKEAPRFVIDAWRAIAECHEELAETFDESYGLAQRVRESGWDTAVARSYSRHFMPKLSLAGPIRFPFLKHDRRRLSARSLVSVEINYRKGLTEISIPDDQLEALIAHLCTGLKTSEDLELQYRGYADLVSIEADEAGEGVDTYERKHGLSGHALHYLSVFRRLAQLNPGVARAEWANWPRKSYVFDRLRVWSMGHLNLHNADNFAEMLLSLPNDLFWHGKGERDLLLGLAKRWPEISDKSRKAIELRLLKGPHEKAKKRDSERSAGWTLSRINWLDGQGCRFTFNLEAVNAKLRSLAPEWKPEYAARAAESSDMRSGWVRTNTDFGAIENVPPHEVIPRLRRGLRRDEFGFVEHDPFLGLSKQRPQFALDALNAQIASDDFGAEFWCTFLRTDIRADDPVELSQLIVHSLIQLPEHSAAKILRASAAWFEAVGKAIWREYPNDFDTFWGFQIAALKCDPTIGQTTLIRQGDSIDWLAEAINSPAGNLAQLLFKIAPTPTVAKAFKNSWTARVEQLLSLPGDSRRYALTILGRNLAWLFHHDADWTKENLTYLFDLDDFTADQEAIWAGLLWAGRIPQRPLYQLLKPHLTKLVHTGQFRRRNLDQNLAGFVLAGWCPDENNERLVSSDELRSLLLDGGQSFRVDTLSTLDRWQDAQRWSSRLSEFLSDVWPTQKSVRTSSISAKLCDLALSRQDDFPEIARLVSRLVGKIVDSNISIPELYRAKDGLAQRHPHELLELLYAVLSGNRQNWPWGAEAALISAVEARPSLRKDPRFIELEAMME